jgi:cyclopropane-fatty-acyl-phospholipid synthase
MDDWSVQNSSGYRYADEASYRNKAQEIISVMTTFGDNDHSTVTDYGCGAGEILKYLVPNLNINIALDSSEKLLKLSEEKNHANVKFILTDFLTYSNIDTNPVWISTGAASQYLSDKHLFDFLKSFAENHSAKRLYMFDTVDPLRIYLMPLNSSYNASEVRFRGKIKSWLLLNYSILAALHKPTKSYKFANPLMGFGYTPFAITKIVETLDLKVSFSSSKFFEYRYHCIIDKQ